MKFMKMSDLVEETGLTRQTIARLAKEGQLPRPIRITARTVRWDRAEVERWFAERYAERERQPKQVTERAAAERNEAVAA